MSEVTDGGGSSARQGSPRHPQKAQFGHAADYTRASPTSQPGVQGAEHQRRTISTVSGRAPHSQCADDATVDSNHFV
eukprot:4706696-Pyramimonas_sp.AAC.1